KSSSGNTINCLLFKANNSKGIILYFHGNAGSLRSWGSVAADFIPLQYDICIADYPGYGKSMGKLSEAHLFTDAQAVYDEMKKRYNEPGVIIYGRSIGTGIAAHLASENNPRKLILESPYFSMKDFSHRLYPFLPSFLLRYSFRTDLFLKEIKCPVFIFHGKKDEVVSYESSLRLKKLFKEKDRLFTIEEGHHNDLIQFPMYHLPLKEILQ
ncbi:MAG TPA: alpha/beta hydrolase, partial [Bacteroidia bacterium]|nr:alpha/beta hydrolase [Bacteroidia bacterium]